MASDASPVGLKSDLHETPEMQIVGRASARQSPSGGQAVVHTGPDVDAHARLLALTDRLHRAIEREKRYPLSARRLGREGTASVAFQLRPDGAIDGLQVAASSGEPALDRAALRAVKGISPFNEAGRYLDETAPFRVDIAFRLR
jgi:protein TonB